MSKKAKKQEQAAAQEESPTEEELMMLQALEEMEAEEQAGSAAAPAVEDEPVQPAGAPASRARQRNRLAALYDLTLPVSIELGRTEMLIEDILKIGRGSVIELDRLAGEPVDVYVGDRRFAEGEVVVLAAGDAYRVVHETTRRGPRPSLADAC